MRKIVINVPITQKHCCLWNRKYERWDNCPCLDLNYGAYRCKVFKMRTPLKDIKEGNFRLLARWQECINADFKTLLEKEGQRILDAMHSAFVTSHRRVKNTGSPYKNHKNKNR